MKTIHRIRNFFSAHLPGSSRVRRRSTLEVRGPMDCMPNEILSHIFQLILLNPDQNPAFSFSISHVCVRWRDLAISSPGLWTRIAFTFPVADAQFAYALCAMQRSDSQPLSILVDCRDPDWDWDEETHSFQWSGMQSIIEQIIPAAGRWKSVDILTDTWLPIYAFLRLTKNVSHLTQLETLSLSRCNAYFAACGQTFQPLALAEPVPLFGGAPAERLQEVSLVGVHVDWEQTLAFRNLTTLEFKYHAMSVLPTLPQFVSMLDGCPQLEHLSIIGWGPQLGAGLVTDITAIVLPSLTKLSFGFVDMAYATQFLSLLQLPSLKRLYLEDVSRTVNPLELQDSSSLLKWLYTSQPAARASFASQDGLPVNPIPLQSVCTLELQSIRSTKEIFSIFFKCFPRITSLSLFDVSDDALLALEPNAGDYKHTLMSTTSTSTVGWVCPALKDVYCQDSDPEVLVDLVAERAAIGSIFRNVTLEFSRNPRPPYNSDQYNRLENIGINVLGSCSSDSSDSE